MQRGHAKVSPRSDLRHTHLLSQKSSTLPHAKITRNEPKRAECCRLCQSLFTDRIQLASILQASPNGAPPLPLWILLGKDQPAKTRSANSGLGQSRPWSPQSSTASSTPRPEKERQRHNLAGFLEAFGLVSRDKDKHHFWVKQLGLAF